MYELADSVIRYHNANFQAKKLEISVFINELNTCLGWLEESIKCLHMERENTFEKTVCQAAKLLKNETIDFMVYIRSQ